MIVYAKNCILDKRSQKKSTYHKILTVERSRPELEMSIFALPKIQKKSIIHLGVCKYETCMYICSYSQDDIIRKKKSG
jgi:hypothetical protein